MVFGIREVLAEVEHARIAAHFLMDAGVDGGDER
jgi:hypothetical protein